MNSQDSIENRVRQIVVDVLDVGQGQVVGDALLRKDLGADSLDEVEVVMAIEEEFGIEVSDDRAEQVRTVGDIIKLVEEAQA